MADGKIVIETELDEKGVEAGLKDLESNLKGLKDLGGVFKGLASSTSTFSKVFSNLSMAVGSGTASMVAGIGAVTIAFAKLYEASKQNFFNNIKNIGNVLKPVGAVISAFASETLQAFSSITEFQFSFSSIAQEAINFESSMAKVSAVMNVTGEGINDLSNKARELGATTRYTANEVASAFNYMGKY